MFVWEVNMLKCSQTCFIKSLSPLVTCPTHCLSHEANNTLLLAANFFFFLLAIRKRFVSNDTLGMTKHNATPRSRASLILCSAP